MFPKVSFNIKSAFQMLTFMFFHIFFSNVSISVSHLNTPASVSLSLLCSETCLTWTTTPSSFDCINIQHDEVRRSPNYYSGHSKDRIIQTLSLSFSSHRLYQPVTLVSQPSPVVSDFIRLSSYYGISSDIIRRVTGSVCLLVYVLFLN